MAQARKPVMQQLKSKLSEVLLNPRVEANRLRKLPDCYKIKLRSAGYRLIYQVIDQEVVVFVVAVDKREHETAYRKAQDRLKEASTSKASANPKPCKNRFSTGLTPLAYALHLRSMLLPRCCLP